MKSFLFYYKLTGRPVVVVQAADAEMAILKFMDWLMIVNQETYEAKFDYTEILVI